MTFEHLALLHLLPTALMTGLIWFVQVVHYPLFAAVGAERFRAYEDRHTAKTTWIVLPTMIAELGLAGWLLFAAPDELMWLAQTGAALLAAVWLSTFALQVPCHQRLGQGFDERTWRRLVAGNWLRTVAWSLRTVAAVALLW